MSRPRTKPRPAENRDWSAEFSEWMGVNAFTSAQLAGKLGIAQRTVDRWRSGEAVPDAPAPQIAPPAAAPGRLEQAWNWTKEQVTPSPETQEKLKMAFDWGRFLTPPGPNNPTSRGGQGGVDKPPIQWTGREPPEMVAEMQQHVEEVLRSILAPQPTLG